MVNNQINNQNSIPQNQPKVAEEKAATSVPPAPPSTNTPQVLNTTTTSTTSKRKKVLLGIATFWPLIYLAIFFIFTAYQFFVAFTNPPSEENGIPITFSIIFILHFMTMILMFILIIIYIRNVFKNDRIHKDKKGLWAVVLFLGNIIAMPIYWYLYIWKD